jgi:hypothetical protein
VIERREVGEAVNEMKNEKASGEDGIANKMLKRGGPAVVEWVVRLLNLCMSVDCSPLEWRCAIIVTLFKGKCNKEWKNYRDISLLSTPGKVYKRVIIERVWEITEMHIRDEQSGFRKGRGCLDQVFMLRCVCEKYLEKQTEVFVAFMDLQKVYDRVDRHVMWEVLMV